MRIKKTPIQKSKFKIDEIALVLIVAFIAIFISFYTRSGKTDKMEAEKITDLILDHHKISFAYDGVIDESKLQEIKKMSYEEFKEYISVKSDFCIYIEDANGNVLLAKGSSKLSRDVTYCKD